MNESNIAKQLVAALKYDLFKLCNSSSISAEGVRELIVERHGLAPNNNLLSNYAFFLAACRNERVTEEIIRCLVEYFPNAANAPDQNREVPLHCACKNKNVTLDTIKLLIKAAPNSVRRVDNQGRTTLHMLCMNNKLDGETAKQVLKFLLEQNPAAVRHADNKGLLPIHHASGWSSPEFSRVLIEAYPGSERMGTSADKGALPLHWACASNSLATVEYLYNIFPDAIHATSGGLYLIHATIVGTKLRDNPADAMEIVQFLLDCDPNQKLIEIQGKSLLHYACHWGNSDSKSEAAIKMRLLTNDLSERCSSESISTEGIRELIEQHGRFHFVANYKFFHRACNNKRVTEEIIQCLLQYFPAAASATKNNEWTALHYACQNHHVSIDIIQLLINAAPDSVRSVDNQGNMPLNVLCHNRKVDEVAATEILKLLIEKHSEAVRHADNLGSLPIHVASGRRSPEFCRVLIEAYPGSEKVANAKGALPLHRACASNSLATVEYLLGLYPDAIGAITGGGYPIHFAIQSMNRREDPATAVEIVQFLLDCDPDQKLIQFKGESLLHFACGQHYNDSNTEAGIQMINVIFSAHPASIRSVNTEGKTSLHSLCDNRRMDKTTAIQFEATAMKILKFLIEKHPEAVRHMDSEGRLPIHIASRWRSPEFCRVLIETYPGSERMSDAEGRLPLHCACAKNSVATVKYLYNLFPDAINHAATNGRHPVHAAILDTELKDDPAATVKIVQFLLDCDPDQKLKQYRGRSLLRCACRRGYSNSNIKTAIQVIKILFDTSPEAIEHRKIATNINRYHQQVKAFIKRELVYARQAKDRRLMTTPDDEGQLRLHRALQNSVRLGSIKLLVKGNPAAAQSPDNSGALPLHVACEHHDSAIVVGYLLSLDKAALKAVDRQLNTALHYACRGAKHDTIAMMLEKYDAASVSKRNANGKLPIDLLWESNAVEDRESVEYTGSVFQLVRAYPEMFMISSSTRKLSHD